MGCILLNGGLMRAQFALFDGSGADAKLAHAGKLYGYNFWRKVV